jgi:hypothetical protein
MKRPNETYIGDGVYASFDGYQFWLRTERDGVDHLVALEPGVLDAFNAFVADVEYKIEVLRKAGM